MSYACACNKKKSRSFKANDKQSAGNKALLTLVATILIVYVVFVIFVVDIVYIFQLFWFSEAEKDQAHTHTMRYE